MKKVLQFILILKFILLNNAISYAGTWEIITHGGFDAAVSAWNKVALIFSDSNYTALFISVAVLGAIVLYLSVYTRIALGSKGNPLSGWGIPFMAGIVIYMAFIVPKDTVVIYDETLNRGPQAIDNIPRGVATIAGLLNKIETGFTDIIWTASDPATDYRIQAGGTGFNALGAASAGLYNLPYSFTATFENFVKDCVFVEMQIPGTSLDINKIQSGEQTYQDVIMASANPAFYTVSYLEKTEGEPLTCFVAAQRIASWLHNQNNLIPAIKAACALAGYDPTVAQSLNACMNASDNLAGRLIDNQTVGSLTGFARQALFAQVTANVTTSINPNLAIKALATSQSMSSFIGMGVHANSWIPVIKETLSALAVGLVPLFAIACVTPLAGKAFSIMAGMFIWLTVWGIVDSVIHSFAMEFAYKSAESLKISGGTSGLASMLMFPSYTAKVGALFGAVRWFGLMLSSIITAMFLRFGGTAMAMLAGSLSGTVQAAGASYGAAMYRTPGSVFSGEVVPTQSLHNAASMAGGINKLAQGLAQQQGGSMAGQAMLGLRYGAGGIAQSGFLSGIESTERGLALGTPENAAMVGNVAGGSAVGGARGQLLKGREGLGFTGTDAQVAEKLAQFIATGSIVNKSIAENMNTKFFGGRNVIQEGMRVDFGLTDNGRLSYLTAEAQDGSRSIKVRDGKMTEEGMLTNTKIGDHTFTGRYTKMTDLATGATITRYDGIVDGKEGHILVNERGDVVIAEGKSGINLAEDNKMTFSGVRSIEELQAISNDLKAQGLTSVAKNIDNAINFMRKQNLTYANVSLVKDPKTGAFATMEISAGSYGRITNFTLNEKGWESVDKALTTGRYGRDVQTLDINKKIIDHRDVVKKGGVEMDYYDPKTKTWHRGIGEYENGKLVLKTGDEKSGINQDIVVFKEAVWELNGVKGHLINKDGKTFFQPIEGGAPFEILNPEALIHSEKLSLVSPSGVVHVKGKQTSDGRFIAGEESSIVISKGELRDKATGKNFYATIYTDSRSGNALAINAESGEVYKYTWKKRADAISLGIKITGSPIASAVEGMAKNAGFSDESAKKLALDAGLLTSAASEVLGLSGIGKTAIEPFKSKGKLPKFPKSKK